MWYPYRLPLHPLKCHPPPYILITLDEKPLLYDLSAQASDAKKAWSEDETLSAGDASTSDEEYSHETSSVKILSDVEEKRKPFKQKASKRRNLLKRASQVYKDAENEAVHLGGRFRKPKDGGKQEC